MREMKGHGDGKKYHGFLGLPRHSKMLLHDLGHDLFGFYIGLVMEAVWFRGNPDIGCVKKSQKQLAGALNCSQSTISRLLSQLERRKYIIRHKNYMRLAYLPLFLAEVAFKIHSRNYANLHELYADMYAVNAELQQKYSDSQLRRGQTNTQRLYNSSKGDPGLSEDDISFIQGDEETNEY